MPIRKLLPHEADLHRELRLRALRDAPDCFGEAAADVEARPRADWLALTGAVTAVGGEVMFIAEADGEPRGSAYGLLDRIARDTGRVGGMWIEPEWRRRGLGRDLLRAVVGWAADRGLRRLLLWAPGHSAGALSLYRSAGFSETGVRRPHPANSGLQIVECELRLSRAKA